MKKLIVSTGVLIALIVIFIIWASINGLVIIIVRSEGHELSEGQIVLPDGVKTMSRVGGAMIGAYTVDLDRDITFSVKVSGHRHKISFGYATPGEFQVNEIDVRPSGEFKVRHHSIP